MKLQLIKHRDILFRDLLRAIAIKNFAWSHSVESQLKWIVDNIDDSDIHVFLRDGDKDVAYMNLVETSFIVNDTEYLAYGVGNVCALEKGKGYGRELMQQVNQYLEQKLRAGLLFCRSALVPFYSQFGWEEVKRDVCEIDSLPKDVHVLTYLVLEKILTLSYSGKLF